jgi:hypothetical protein
MGKDSNKTESYQKVQSNRKEGQGGMDTQGWSCETGQPRLDWLGGSWPSQGRAMSLIAKYSLSFRHQCEIISQYIQVLLLAG